MATAQQYAYEPQKGQAKQPLVRSNGDGYDVESGAGYSAFADKVVRQGFIRKVFGLTSIQLAVTTAFIALFVFSPAIKAAVQSSPGLLYSAFALQIGTLIGLLCCDGAAKRYPTNYGLLALFTLAESYLVGVICTLYSADIVVTAFGLTAGISLGLTLFAMQSKYDFTRQAGLAFSFGWSLLLLGIVAVIFRDRLLYAVYCWLGALLFSWYIVIDVQMIVGGTHRLKFGVDDYVYAALNLYLDIINLFLKLLRILNSIKK